MTPQAHPKQPSLHLPGLAVALFLAAIAALVWLTRDYDLEEQRTALLHDVLWIEQSLHFQLQRNEELLTQLGPELLRSHRDLAPATVARLRQALQTENGLVRIQWIDAAGAPLGAMPPAHAAPTPEPPPSNELIRLAQAMTGPVYGPAHPVLGGDYHFELYVPIFAGETLQGTVVGVYSLRNLLGSQLPWWFSERYRAVILDADGKEIASKTKVAPLASREPYSVPLDPPGHGLTLQITAYQQEVRWIPLLLIASMVLLAALIVWSLWQMRRHIARRVAAEKALRAESAFRQAMEDSLLTGLRARDLNGRITYVNPAFCRMVGYNAEELIGHAPPMPYWDPEHQRLSEELHQRILAGKGPPAGIERHFVRKNGEALDALLFEAPLIDSEGRHTGWMGSLLDITEQKRMRELARQQEERLNATSRLVTMGEMASTLAHELNQPLAAISTYASGCLNWLDQPEPDLGELHDILERLSRQAERAALIVRRVHDFVRRSDPKREPVDVNALILESIALIEPDARKHSVRIEFRPGTRIPEIAADPVMLQQVFVNLIRNGIDAMTATPAARRQLLIATREAADMVEVKFADHGAGIPPDAAQRLFQPFFTTKAEGMGMGLNICRSIAELHRGKLGFEANPAGGTIFTFSLPVETL